MTRHFLHVDICIYADRNALAAQTLSNVRVVLRVDQWLFYQAFFWLSLITHIDHVDLAHQNAFGVPLSLQDIKQDVLPLLWLWVVLNEVIQEVLLGYFGKSRGWWCMWWKRFWEFLHDLFIACGVQSRDFLFTHLMLLALTRFMHILSLWLFELLEVMLQLAVRLEDVPQQVAFDHWGSVLHEPIEVLPGLFLVPLPLDSQLELHFLVFAHYPMSSDTLNSVPAFLLGLLFACLAILTHVTDWVVVLDDEWALAPCAKSSVSTLWSCDLLFFKCWNWHLSRPSTLRKVDSFCYRWSWLTAL